MKKILIYLVAFLVIFPGFASASTMEDLQKQISALLSQVASLQQQLAQKTSQTCAVFSSNLQIGNSGSNVTSLQKFLEDKGFDIDNSEVSLSNFGKSTASAVVSFQDKYKSEILTPAGLSRGTGYVGARTRAKMNALYGCKINQSSVIPTNTTLTDIDRVKNILIDIKQGYITGNSSLILQHASVATSKLVTSGTFSSPVSTFTVNNVYQSGSNIVANITVTGGPTDQSPTQNMVFIKEGDNWKFDLGATLNFSVSTPTTSVPVTTTTTQTSNLSITNTSPLSNAKVGIDYAIPLYVSGGPSGVSTNMYSWSIISGSLPPGLILAGSPSGEVIAGAATTAGTYDFTLNVSYGSQYMYKSFTITVIP